MNHYKDGIYIGADDEDFVKEGEPKMNKKELAKELHDLAKPLSDWLYLHGTPHSTIIVTQADVELLTGEMAEPFELKD